MADACISCIMARHGGGRCRAASEYAAPTPTTDTASPRHQTTRTRHRHGCSKRCLPLPPAGGSSLLAPAPVCMWMMCGQTISHRGRTCLEGVIRDRSSRRRADCDSRLIGPRGPVILMRRTGSPIVGVRPGINQGSRSTPHTHNRHALLSVVGAGRLCLRALARPSC